jgi:hypothetical protein
MGHGTAHRSTGSGLSCSAATEQHYTCDISGTKRLAARQFFSVLWEVPMTSQVIDGACAFAWRNYMLLHSGVSENDERRSALRRYVADLRDAGENRFDLLQIAAVAYLKKLDELHDDRGARLAADQALAECSESQNAESGAELSAASRE